eukprot:1997173-Rhodomonas_salina.2
MRSQASKRQCFIGQFLDRTVAPVFKAVGDAVAAASDAVQDMGLEPQKLFSNRDAASALLNLAVAEPEPACNLTGIASSEVPERAKPGVEIHLAIICLHQVSTLFALLKNGKRSCTEQAVYSS